jgi:hypothetical protein
MQRRKYDTTTPLDLSRVQHNASKCLARIAQGKAEPSDPAMASIYSSVLERRRAPRTGQH